MPSFLLQAMQSGIFKTVWLAGVGVSNSKGPESGKVWMLLGGTIDHTTGTDSLLLVMPKNKAYNASISEEFSELIGYEVAATGSQKYPMFRNSGFHPIFLQEDMSLQLTGDALNRARIQVIEFDRKRDI